MDSYMDQYRTGPETLGGRYMRLFWHPIYRSEDLKPGWAKPIKIMSENFTLYRGEGGAAHVVAFQCAHRDAANYILRHCSTPKDGHVVREVAD